MPLYILYIFNFNNKNSQILIFWNIDFKIIIFYLLCIRILWYWFNKYFINLIKYIVIVF